MSSLIRSAFPVQLCDLGLHTTKLVVSEVLRSLSGFCKGLAGWGGVPYLSHQSISGKCCESAIYCNIHSRVPEPCMYHAQRTGSLFPAPRPPSTAQVTNLALLPASPPSCHKPQSPVWGPMLMLAPAQSVSMATPEVDERMLQASEVPPAQVSQDIPPKTQQAALL